MKLRSTITRIACAAGFVLILLVFAQTSARADEFTATIDTSSLIGTGNYQVAFILDNPGGSDDPGNSVTLTGLSFNGGTDIGGTILTIGDESISGEGSGSTIIGGSTITLTDSTLENGVATSFTPGTAITFSGSITTSTPDDEFIVILFNSAGVEVGTSNSNDFLFSVTPPPAGGTPAPVTYPITAPEPSSLLMLALGLAGLLGLGLMRKRARLVVA